MLIRFSSNATESITMFGDVATRLIKMLGASGVLPNAFDAEDISAALRRLKEHLSGLPGKSEASAAASKDAKDEGHVDEVPITLAIRAAPLIHILERAAAAKVPVMWEQV